MPSMDSLKRILIVDDNPDAIAVLSIWLTRSGHEVHRASDGQTALDLARKLRPHYVFLDLGLPRMSGYEVARQMRHDPGLGNTRLIALTGHAQENDRKEAWEAGFDQYLVKPVDLAFIDSLLGNRL